MGNEQMVERAKEKKIPYIILNYFDKKSEDNCIGVDNEAAAREVIDYLVGSGISISPLSPVNYTPRQALTGLPVTRKACKKTVSPSPMSISSRVTGLKIRVKKAWRGS
jgi:hypothetical protein